MQGFLTAGARRFRARFSRGAERARPYPDWEAIEAGPDWRALTEEDRRIIRRALPYTMTGIPRLHALIEAVRYCVRREIPGAFAECGVWRGGSVLAMIATLEELQSTDREIYLYDTFEGMTEPTEHDISPFHRPASELWRESDGLPWPELFARDVFDEASVRATLLETGYPESRLHFVRGAVEETIPGTVPFELALLRLDTDWYESTRHELQHLYPVLVDGGVLILDDYGYWEGQRRAVDEYFVSQAPPLMLGRIDNAGRIAVKH
jgi:O-methyltransferase